MPDKDRGDLGIEAFTHSGYAYQCYAAEEPLAVQKCYEKQRDKLSRDLAKLVTNKTDFSKLLGSVKVSRYVYLVHKRESKQLIQHAQKKTKEVRGWGLPFVDKNFHIVVETLDDYRAEVSEMHKVPLPMIAAEEVDDAHLGEWAEGHASLVQTADSKLAVVMPSQARRATVLKMLLRQYLEGADGMDKLRDRAPEVYASVLRTQRQLENTLALEYSFNAKTDYAEVASMATGVATQIDVATEVLNLATNKTLAWMTIADWLMRCPLDFPDD